MLMQFVYLALFGVATFIAVTAAAFVYLDWWQAILVSVATFLFIVSAIRYLILRTVRRISGFASNLVRGIVAPGGEALKGAEVTVHSVREVGGSDGGQAVYEVDLSVAPAGNAAWHPGELTLVAADAPARDLGSLLAGGAGEYHPESLGVLIDGEVQPPPGAAMAGLQRLRFRLTLPRSLRALKCRYRWESFGQLTLPRPALGGG